MRNQPQSEQAAPSIVAEEVFNHLAKLKVKQDIADVLAKIKNGVICRRVLTRVMPGITENDAEFIPTFLWIMFGTRGANQQPEYPEFPYPGNCREMSLLGLWRLLNKRYGKSASYMQLRRIFKALKQHKLVTNIKLPQQDPVSGKWTSTSHYRFNTENWQALLKESAKTPKFKTGKKRKLKRGNLDEVVTEAHKPRVKKAGKVAQEPAVFSGKPCGEPNRVVSLQKGEAPVSPGVTDSAARKSPLAAAPAEPKKELTSSAAVLFEFLSRKEASSQLKAKIEKEGPRYIPDSSNPGWQILLEAVLDYKVTNGQLMEDWKTTLYNPEGGVTPLTLKPRIPDCTVLVPDEQSSTCGVWAHEGAFIRLTPADLELGEFVTRVTGCPMRAQDWQQLARLSHRKATDPGGLTFTRLAALLQAFPDKVSELLVKMDGKVYDHSTIVPEVFENNSNQDAINRGAFHDHVRSEKLAGYLPFLHCADVSANALLSPGNAGKLLFNWDKLWTAFREHTGPSGSLNRRQLSGIHGPVRHIAPETVAELDRGVRLASRVLGYLHDGLDLSSELTPLAYIQHAPQGVYSLLPETRQKLHQLMLKLYLSTPHIWYDLERWMGAETFAAAMSVQDIAAFRATAHKRVSEMVRERWQEPYTRHEPHSL